MFYLKGTLCSAIVYLLLVTIHLIKTTQAVKCISDVCNCRTISNKETAYCDGLNLKELPSCQDASINDKQLLDKILVLNISGNSFPVLPAEFFSRSCLRNLQKIYIQQVQLESINDRAFYPLMNLIELSLQTNLLRHVPSRELKEYTNLRSLDLSFNNINDIKNGAFSTLSSLQTLFLHRNRISHVDVDAFRGLNQIQTITLNDNRLINIKPEVFVNLNNLHTLYLENNDWVCNCKMQPFKRMLLIKTSLTIQDNPICSKTLSSLKSMDLENFQCSPQLMTNYSDTQVVIREGSNMRLRCATYIETFGAKTADHNYFLHTKIVWSWNGNSISNNSRGADELSKHQKFIIQEHIHDVDDKTKVKISNLQLSSVIHLNAGTYICNVSNSAGYNELDFHVRIIPFISNSQAVSSGNFESRNIIPAASSSGSSLSSFGGSSNSYTKTKIIPGDNGEHILFGLVFGILCGIFIVLVIFSIILVVFFRRQRQPGNDSLRHPHELSNVDNGSNDDNHTFDEAVETNTNSTVDKIAMVSADFNPLIVNPVQKPPRLGIPDVSSLYSNPSWTLDRNNGFGNRSRYASYAETEPLYSDYYTIYRPNRQMAKIDENRTFISDTASEV